MNLYFDEAHGQCVRNVSPLRFGPADLRGGRFAPGDQSVTWPKFLSLAEVELTRLVYGRHSINTAPLQTGYRSIGAERRVSKEYIVRN